MATYTYSGSFPASPSAGETLSMNGVEYTYTAQGSWEVTEGTIPEGTSVLSTGETGGTKYLREDGDGTCSWQPVADDSHNHVIDNIDGLQTALDLKAPLASPALTGTPSAPTAAANTNTTQIATTAFVQAELTELVGAAPAALNTLQELGDALGDDANFASTVTTNLATKVDKVTGKALSENDFTDALKSKLDAIEAGATADQTGAEIKTAYEAEADTNAYTDAEKTKLANIVQPSSDFSAVSEDILPLFDEVYDLGSSDKKWYDGFFTNNVRATNFIGTSAVLDDVLLGDTLYADNRITTEPTLGEYTDVAGEFTIEGSLDVTGDYLKFPSLTSRNPVTSPTAGMVRFNSVDVKFEGHDGTKWASLGGSEADDDGNIHMDGNLVVTGDVISLSDENEKSNIASVTSALDIVNGINGVYYTLNSDEDRKRRVGVIAQDVEKVLPEVVYENDGVKSVAYGNIVGVLVEAIKELQEEIKELKGA